MKIGTRTRYGLRTILEIAMSDDSGGVFQKDISVNQEISNKYLDHIIHALKTAGLITNVKGKKSGYRLLKNPSDITVYDVHQAFEPTICLVECLNANYSCERSKKCLVQGVWKDLNHVIISYLRSITIQDLVTKHVSSEEIRALT
ncbi:MAG TPA: Rrf2 family transcriptional regulator [Bacteroidales bacterium]|nr:Rrf2 family transcriptional regulator [Bacteroidales bacterium]